MKKILCDKDGKFLSMMGIVLLQNSKTVIV